MNAAIMQPYFLPYIGYFQLIAVSDIFVVYDNIKYTKKGWINRNRFLQNGTDAIFSLPLKKDSDSLDVVGRELAPDYRPEKILNQFRASYLRAPYFSQTYPLIESILLYPERNLFRYIYHSIEKICAYLDIRTQFQISSSIPIDHDLRGQDKVLAICKSVQATTYTNAIGGIDLYSKETFRENGMTLQFLQSHPFEYAQFQNEFVPWLSIIDVLMFNPPERVLQYLKHQFNYI